MSKGSRKQRSRFPDRKISETFLEFVSPLFKYLSPGADVHEIEKVIEIGFTAWNAVILSNVEGAPDYLDMIKTKLEHDIEGFAMVSELIDRKRKVFGGDQRLIGNYRVRMKHGELRLWAEARDPYTIANHKKSN